MLTKDTVSFNALDSFNSFYESETKILNLKSQFDSDFINESNEFILYSSTDHYLPNVITFEINNLLKETLIESLRTDIPRINVRKSTISTKVDDEIDSYTRRDSPNYSNGSFLFINSSSEEKLFINDASFISPLRNILYNEEDCSDLNKLSTEETNFSDSVLSYKNSPKKIKKCCSCSKSKCLKLYCECFKKNIYCSDCNCPECLNKESNEDLRQESIKFLKRKSKFAFKEKIVRDDLKFKHIKGCNCKNSSCQKNYCECYQNGIGCGENCKCSNCKNKQE